VHRTIRTGLNEAGVTAEQASALVDLLIDEVLNRRSVALAAPADNVEEPEVLRRVELHTAADMAAVLDWRLPEPAATDGLSPRSM
jgi:hypothetical protein